MPYELKIPTVGESITEVQISEWLKSEGDEVKPDESVAIIDSEKTTFELPAPAGGRLVKILHAAGDTVKVGEVVAQIDSDGQAAAEKSVPAKAEHQPEPVAKNESASKATRAEGRAAEQKTGKAEPEEGGARKESASPAKIEPISKTESARKQVPEEKSNKGEMEENGAKTEPKEQGAKKETSHEDLEAGHKAVHEPMEKTPETKPTVLNEAAKPAAEREEEIVPMTMLRRTAAHRLVEARQTMAMLTTFNEVDMSAVQALRKEHGEAFEKRYQVKLGLMSFFVKAAIDALKQFPKLNAEIRGDDIVYRNYFDIGVAIASGRGLVVPLLRHAERSSFAELEQAIGDFARRAGDGKLKPIDLEGGTFTITNGGVFGSLLSTPIINPPQTGILGLHTIQPRPVALGGQVVVRPMMYLALTYDHRLVDGREAVLFLRRVKETVESPARMLVEI